VQSPRKLGELAKRKVSPKKPDRFAAQLGCPDGALAVARCAVTFVVGVDGVPESADLRACPLTLREQANLAVTGWRFYPVTVDGVRSRWSSSMSFLFVE